MSNCIIRLFFSFMLSVVICTSTGFASESSATANQTSPYAMPKCPPISELVEPDSKAIHEIRSSLPTLIREAYTGDEYSNWEIKRIRPLPQTDVYYQIGKRLCGENIAQKSFLIELNFPKFLPSASMSQGQLFIVKTHEGWTPWYRYH